ncbi:MAG: ABC transporter permease [Bacteroidota bacterium]|nr:ABC transporter permease [Bacteroidota bacterium]
MNLFFLSWKNILAKPLNSFMSVLLFALSVGLITFLLLFNHQFKQGLENNLAGVDLVIGAKGSPLQLILNSMYHIDAPTGNIPISGASPFLNPAHPLLAASIPLSLGDSYGAFRIVGTPPSIFPFYNAESIEGDVYKNDFEVVLGYTVAKKLHLHLGDEFNSTHGLEDNPDLRHDHSNPFVVVGILQRSATVLDQLILTTPQTVWKVHEHDSTSTAEVHAGHDHSAEEHHRVSGIIKVIDSAEVKTLSDSIIQQLRGNPEKDITSLLLRFKSRTNIQSLNLLRNINQNTDLMAASPALEINRLYSMMGSGADALSYIAMLIACVAAISIFISLYTTLRERRYEMAIMRVNGAAPIDIFQMIVGEGLWISFMGIVIGLVFGHGGIHLAGKILEQSYKYQFSGAIWLPEEMYIIVGGIIIGLIAAIIPAIQGARTELHSTLAEG